MKSRTIFERYAGAAETGPLELNETLETIIGGRSCRRYDEREITRETLDRLMAAAQSAPTSCNMQNWSVVAIREPSTKARIRRISGEQAHIEEAPLVLCFLADLARLQRVAKANGISHDALDYIELLLVAVIDASLAAQNLVTAAASFGLGTCYIGSIRNDLPQMCDILGLPEKVAPVFGLTVGYPHPDVPTAIKPRLAPSSVLHMERYDGDAAVAPVAPYEEALEAFNRAQGRQMPLWGVRSAERVASVAKMEGRDDLWSELKAQGFAFK